MSKRLFRLLTAILFLMPFLSGAQDLNIKDDTIRVSAGAFPVLRFMGEIRSGTQLLCDDYKLVLGETSVTVRPKVSKPAPACLLIVSEGSSSSPRQHTFIVTFAKEIAPSELLHDYSSKDAIKERIEYLEDAKKKAAEQPKIVAHDDDNPAPADPQPAANTKGKVKGKVAEQQQDPQPATGSGNDDDEIKNIPRDKLLERVKIKIDAFTKACEQLCAKQDIDESVKYGMRIFNNDEESIVESFNTKTNSKRQQKIRKYFINLTQLPYKKVTMTAYDVHFVSKFHKCGEKTWCGSAVIMQDFKGFKDNIMAYSDKTNKTIDVKVEITEIIKDGKPVSRFEVFLGNISVTNIPQ